MNRMYRWQRHIYDGTRRYYLLGRDQLIDDLHARPGQTVLEIGCGTGRNLIRAAQAYPGTRCFGIDVSTEMLTTAIESTARAGLGKAVRVAHGDATAFNARTLLGVAAFDHIMICYSLSMIPDWRSVIDRAVAQLKHGGTLHIVDFGQQEGLPSTFRTLLRRWLTLFGVTPRETLEATLRRIASRHGATLEFGRPFRGYAQSARLTLPAGSQAA
jgi:S-adenosylmethionine-diacylgycerolhomoserine-N-methlytransferase